MKRRGFIGSIMAASAALFRGSSGARPEQDQPDLEAMFTRYEGELLVDAAQRTVLEKMPSGYQPKKVYRPDDFEFGAGLGDVWVVRADKRPLLTDDEVPDGVSRHRPWPPFSSRKTLADLKRLGDKP